MNERKSDPCKNNFRIKIAHDSNVHIIEKKVCNQVFNWIQLFNKTKKKKIVQIHVWVNNKIVMRINICKQISLREINTNKMIECKKEVDFLFACMRHVCGKQYPANIPTIKSNEMKAIATHCAYGFHSNKIRWILNWIDLHGVISTINHSEISTEHTHFPVIIICTLCKHYSLFGHINIFFSLVGKLIQGWKGWKTCWQCARRFLFYLYVIARALC